MHLIAYDGSAPPVCAPAARSPPRPPSAGPRAPLPVLALVIGQTPRPDLVEPLRAHLRARLPPEARAEVVCRGALDGADARGLRAAMGVQAAADSCPLVTRLSDGQTVTVSEGALVPLLQRQLREAVAARGAERKPPFAAAVLLCAGEFAGLRGRSALPLLLPSLAVVAAVRGLVPGPERLTLLVPNEAQRPFARSRWERAGMPGAASLALPESAGPAELGAAVARVCTPAPGGHAGVQVGRLPASELSGQVAGGRLPGSSVCVLDYIGHSEEAVDAARQAALKHGTLLFDAGAIALEALAALLLAQIVRR
mmetsp:Transcript_48556/g.152606  ORF Transcript_48556/g.152606 Transcript_48556/m.152606 type:complete len:311 (-) Transcript_48556:60-992(-)